MPFRKFKVFICGGVDKQQRDKLSSWGKGNRIFEASRSILVTGSAPPTYKHFLR